MRKEIPAEERRRVPKTKKVVIAAVLCAGALFLVWFKIPFVQTYTATLVQHEAGESAVYGDTIEVEVSVRVQRYFFAEPTHVGTVTVNGDVFSTAGGAPVPVRSLFGAAVPTDSFLLICSEWHGAYLVTRAVVSVEDGRICDLSVWDENGVCAGRYGRLSKNYR